MEHFTAQLAFDILTTTQSTNINKQWKYVPRECSLIKVVKGRLKAVMGVYSTTNCVCTTVVQNRPALAFHAYTVCVCLCWRVSRGQSLPTCPDCSPVLTSPWQGKISFPVPPSCLLSHVTAIKVESPGTKKSSLSKSLKNDLYLTVAFAPTGFVCLLKSYLLIRPCQSGIMNPLDES